MVATFILKPEAFMQRIYFSNPPNRYSPKSEFLASLLGHVR